MKLNKYFVIDFDSTFTKVEAFDVLADISLQDHPEKETRKEQIHQITNKGMDGSISFRESLEQRLNLLSPSKHHLDPLIQRLKGSVSESFKRNKDFFQTYADNIFIISNGRVNECYFHGVDSVTSGERHSSSVLMGDRMESELPSPNGIPSLLRIFFLDTRLIARKPNKL